MVMESAAVYSASVISLMITYSLESNAQYTVLDLVSPFLHQNLTRKTELGLTIPMPDCTAHRYNVQRDHPAR